MGSGLDRTEFVRRDCVVCKGKGYRFVPEGEIACAECAGSGLEEKEVPFKFDGERTEEELDEIFGRKSERSNRDNDDE